MADIHEYRGYLATHVPIAEPETRFLDASDDLICLSDVPEDSDDGEEDDDMVATPIPRRQSILFGAPKTPGDYFGQEPASTTTTRPATIPINLAMVIAVVLPTLIFNVIPGYLGRMVVVILVGTGVLGVLVQSNAVGTQATRDFCICVGAYGSIMALIAGLCG